MKDDKEEQAFPHTNLKPGLGNAYEWENLKGLTKREWFAGIAIIGIMIAGKMGSVKEDAEISFVYADAMIEASKK